LEWKARSAELFPESKEPKKGLKKNSLHYADCPELGRIVIQKTYVNPRTAISGGFPDYIERITCLDCGGSKEK
ncbi:MAG: hypothetical protein ACHQT7_00850, partial [Candidatus Levyibacteriota bacterium]